jgi:hypothetical protein
LALSTTAYLTLFLAVFVVLLLFLSTYQLILLIEQSLINSRHQISVLRAIGLSSKDTQRLENIELQCVMASALIIAGTT